MIYKMPKPSENMLKPAGELAEMTRQYNEALIKEQDQKIALKEAAAERGYRDYISEQTDRIQSQMEATRNRSQKLNNIKSGLLVECLGALYEASAVGPLTRRDKVVVKNLLNGFVKENGVDNLLMNFRTKNLTLSEFARLVDKYYDRVLNESSKGSDPQEEDRPAIGLEVKECDFTQTIADDFFADLADVDIDDASKMIKHRVSDAINDFMDQNAADKIEYQEIIQDAQDHIGKSTTEESAVAFMNQAKLKIRESKQHKPKSIFHVMVESLTTKALKDEDLKARYVKEATVDMESIVNDTALIYTMLEMANTTNMVNVNEQFLDQYLSSLTA